MVPRQKAGHMTACHPIVQNIKKSLANRGRPHMSRCRTMHANDLVAILLTLWQLPRATCPWLRLEKPGVFLLR